MNAASWLEGLPAHERWRAWLLGEGPRIATWILALALGVQAALIVTDLAGAGRARAQAPLARHPAHPHSLDLAVITGAHLFGTAPAARQDGADAPQTNIQLVLTGTIAGNDPQNGLAILGQTAQTAKVYAVGDNVPGGAKLHSVYSDRVVIDRNGQLESLALPHQPSSSAAPPSAAALPGENPSFERMRRMISEQPGLLADVLRPQPVMDHGHMNGFRVYPGRNRQAFLRLGLRPGDQVTAINGTPLDDRDRGDAILRTLSSSSEARVTVIRAGQQQDLTLNLAQVEQEADSLATQSPAAQTGVVPAPAEPPAAPPPVPPAGGPGGQ
ncbi:MAG TPA: type II secretion system protein GspC [Steroidobacteraceae bacterium]|jgi:general secretion pathway protein C|nr:type II secretion system protein GspC [Steroidobacteraceae bacterium]